MVLLFTLWAICLIAGDRERRRIFHAWLRRYRAPGRAGSPSSDIRARHWLWIHRDGRAVCRFCTNTLRIATCSSSNPRRERDPHRRRRRCCAGTLRKGMRNSSTIGCGTGERWGGELIESHSSYPMLAFYRSQHDGHSWLATLAVLLDTCTLIITGADGGRVLQAAATFSAACRVLDEMINSLDVSPIPWDATKRLDPRTFTQLGILLTQSITGWRVDGDSPNVTAQLRRAYEPQLGGLSAYLLLPLPDRGQ